MHRNKMSFPGWRPVLGLLALFVALGSWALSSPVASSPDDDFHIASIWCGQGLQAGYCEAGKTAASRMVPVEIMQSPCFAYKATTSASCQPAETSDSLRLIETTRGNFQGIYPPVFYAVMHFFVTPSMQKSILLMRVFNSAVLVAVLGGLLSLAPRSRRTSAVWGYALTIVPLGMFIIPSTNPSSWAVIGIGGFWLAALFALENRGPRRWLSAGLGVILAVIAAGSRGDAGIFIGLSVAVVFLVAWPKRKTVAFWWWAAALVLVATLALLTFLLSGQSAFAAQGLNPNSPKSDISSLTLAILNTLQLPNLWAGVFGSWGLGWLDTLLPASVGFSSLSVFVAISYFALFRSSRSAIFATGLVAVSLWFFPVYLLGKTQAYVGSEVQPRYLLPLFTLFAGVVLWNWRESRLRTSGLQTWLVLCALSFANALALNVNINRYIRGQDVRTPWLDSGVEWWWANAPSPMTVWVVGAASFALALTLAAPLLAGAPASRRAEHRPIPAE
jgi:hypothetical protein